MIPETNPYNNWSGNGSSITFDFDFYIEDATQLAVYRTGTNGIQTKLTYGTDYSINEFKNKNGSYITFPIAGSSYNVLATGEVISLCLTLPISQENPFGNSSYLNLETLEYSLDYLTRICQIIERELERAVKVQEGSNIDADELVANINTIVGDISSVDTVAENISNINTVSGISSAVSNVASDLTNINTVASNLTTIDNAPIWAEGTDEQVQAIGGTHSSKGWSELSTNANISLSNLNAAGEAKFNAKANDNAVVHLTGNQTIAGDKTFTDELQIINTAPVFNIKNTDTSSDWSQTPLTDFNIGQIIFNDKNNKNTGFIKTQLLANGSRQSELGVSDKTSTTTSGFAIGYDSSNNMYTYCPACSNVNSIVTTAGINKAANGYVKLGNGIIIQWGATAGSSGTVTLPVAFSDVNSYQITLNEFTNGYSVTEPRSCGVSQKTTTTFSWSSARQSGQEGVAYNTTWMWLAIGY